jgi:hypothetical protein
MSDKPLHWWQWLIPTYGNWGGPGWSSGRYTDSPSEVDWNVNPVDAMDEAFREHDYAIQRLGMGRKAHKVLANTLKDIDPPYFLYGYTYRFVCIAVFTVLGLGA